MTTDKIRITDLVKPNKSVKSVIRIIRRKSVKSVFIWQA